MSDLQMEGTAEMRKNEIGIIEEELPIHKSLNKLKTPNSQTEKEKEKGKDMKQSEEDGRIFSEKKTKPKKQESGMKKNKIHSEHYSDMGGGGQPSGSGTGINSAKVNLPLSDNVRSATNDEKSKLCRVRSSNDKFHNHDLDNPGSRSAGASAYASADGTSHSASLGRSKEDRKSTNQICKHNICKFIDHSAVVIFMTCVTIYALFFDDIRILGFGLEADNAFYSLTIIALVLFSVEICLASYSKDDYFNSFFFWLDIVATISLIQDIGWIWEATGV
jgi:hypothetical protein